MSAPHPPTRAIDDVSVGDPLPTFELAITPTAIIAGALASRDFQEVHHDRDIAQARGSADIFMNILTTNGYVGRYVTDWAGPEALLRRVDIRLGAPNYPGDTMVLSGRVTEKTGAVLTLAIEGHNRLGVHVSGEVILELPGPEGR